MCQSVDEGGKRCPSSDSSHRRGKDRATYKAKQLEATSMPVSLKDFEAVRAGLKIEYDGVASISEVKSFLELKQGVEGKLAEYNASTDIEAKKNILKEVEVMVRELGAYIDARARALVSVNGESIGEARTKIDEARNKARRKFKREVKKLEEALLEGEAYAVAYGELKRKFAKVESGDNEEAKKFLTLMRGGYGLALSEVRAMGFMDPGDAVGLDLATFARLLPTAWLKELSEAEFSALLYKGEGEIGISGYWDLSVKSTSEIPFLSDLEGAFIDRRSGGLISIGATGDTYRGESVRVVEGYFVDKYVGRVSQGLDPRWLVCVVGLDGISGVRSSLGGLIGVGDKLFPVLGADDDMRQFVLGLLAVC